MSVLIISLLFEHTKCASWAYEFVPVTFGKCLFLLSCFGLSLPCALCGLQQPVGLGFRGDGSLMDPFVPEQWGGCTGKVCRGLFKALTIFNP